MFILSIIDVYIIAPLGWPDFRKDLLILMALFICRFSISAMKDIWLSVAEQEIPLGDDKFLAICRVSGSNL